MQRLAEKINDAGGHAEAAAVDTLDGQAVAEHLEEVIGQAGRLDVSAVGLPQPGIQGIPLTELAADAFARPTRSTAEPCDISSRAHHNPTPHTAAA